MRDNRFDRTIERNDVQKWRFLMQEYEQVKAGQSETFATVGAFYRHHGTGSQTFRKYDNRHGLHFSERMADNGAEFVGRSKPKEHPFEAPLLNLGIKHRYTRPYRSHSIFPDRGETAPTKRLRRVLSGECGALDCVSFASQ